MIIYLSCKIIPISILTSTVDQIQYHASCLLTLYGCPTTYHVDKPSNIYAPRIHLNPCRWPTSDVKRPKTGRSSHPPTAPQNDGHHRPNWASPSPTSIRIDFYGSWNPRGAPVVPPQIPGSSRCSSEQGKSQRASSDGKRGEPRCLLWLQQEAAAEGPRRLPVRDEAAGAGAAQGSADRRGLRQLVLRVWHRRESRGVHRQTTQEDERRWAAGSGRCQWRGTREALSSVRHFNKQVESVGCTACRSLWRDEYNYS